MADCNRVVADPDFFDEQAHDFLPLRDIERLGARAQAGAELDERVTQAQIAGLIDGSRFDGLPLQRDRLLLGAKRRHPRPQVVQGHQVLLVRGDQAVHGRGHADLLTCEVVEALPRGIRLPRRVPPSRQFGLDDRGILEEPQHLAPHERIQVILPRGRRRAHGTVRMLPAVAPPAAIHVPPPRHRVAALGADQEPLQQGGSLRPPSRKAGVLLQLRLRQREGFLREERGHGNFHPFVARPFATRLVAHRQAPGQPQRPRDALPGTRG